jgi:hypothetical protein
MTDELLAETPILGRICRAGGKRERGRQQKKRQAGRQDSIQPKNGQNHPC